jgi:hypothetical protein
MPKRITISEIQQHSWFMPYMPVKIVDAGRIYYHEPKNNQLPRLQSVEEIMGIIQEARTTIPRPSSWNVADVDGDVDGNVEEKIDDVNGDFVKMKLV